MTKFSCKSFLLRPNA